MMNDDLRWSFIMESLSSRSKTAETEIAGVIPVVGGCSFATSIKTSARKSRMGVCYGTTSHIGRGSSSHDRNPAEANDSCASEDEIVNGVRRVNEQQEEAKLPIACVYESRNSSEACLGELAGLEGKLERVTTKYSHINLETGIYR